jgi:hypothetical protein
MRTEELRALLVRVLKRGTTSQSQILYVLRDVGTLRAQLSGERVDPHSPERHLDESEKWRVQELVWMLIIQGVLMPGAGDGQSGWPFLQVTEYGKKCLAADRLLPHDPDGFLDEFRNQVPDADPVITEYLTEALQCFLRGLNRAAAVMLGGASEKAVLLLVEAYGNAISDSGLQQTFQGKIAKATTLLRKYEEFEKRFGQSANALPSALRENVASLLHGVFDLIRNSRNEAGHPATGVVVDRDVVYSHLRLFVPYAARIYALIRWFGQNAV